MRFFGQCLVLILIGPCLAQLSSDIVGCPPAETILPCRCLLRNEDYQIWCSHSDLPKVMEGLRAVGQFITKPIDELILENNYLPSFPGRTFFPLKVLRLMLRYNGLERVSSDWLAGLELSLMELFIVEPELRGLPEDSLLQLENLEAVTLQTSLMKRLPIFSGLQKLRYLQLESLSLLELHPRNFKNNPSLEKLHVSASPRLNRLEASVLHDLPNLTLLNISYCGISWIHPRAISRLPSLREIDLIGNKITDAGMVGRASRDLPALETIRLDHNYIETLEEAAFVDLPSLKKLFLSNNRITELNHGAFHRVPQLKSLNLNNNNLRRIHPESFLQQSGSGLEELWLVENDISHVNELRALLDALPRLTFLDMSYNNLEAIPFGTLRGHATLEHLHLDYNKIHVIDREAFMAMPALRELRLKNNSLTDRLDGPFWNLPALKGLDLSGNFFRRLEPRFLANLPSLRRIDLSVNDLKVIHPETFLASPALEHVNLSLNALDTLHPATFRHLLNLYELDVSYNHLIEFVPGLPRGIEYLHMSNNEITAIPMAPSPDLDLPSLRILDLGSNKIQRIPLNTMQSFPQLRRLYLKKNLLQKIEENSLDGLTRLESLDLEENRIYHLHPSCFREMIELRSLNLRNNRLDLLTPDVFKKIPRLKRLDLSKNQLAEILPGTLDHNQELQSVDASDNTLVQLSPTFYRMKNLRNLDLTNNRVKNIDPTILSSLDSLKELKMSKNFIHELKQGAFHNLQHLKLLHLDSNELEFIEPNAIRNLPVLKSIRLGQNKLKEIPNQAFTNLPSLQVVELQENNLQFIAPNAFNAVPHLLMLNVSHNEIGNMEQAGLRSIRSLEMLDLSNNRLSKITGPSLEKMEWLVELKMDNNGICGVEGAAFNSMPRLRVLTLRNNKMISFPEHAVHKLRGNIAVLDIDGNPLSCACNLLWLQAWLQESSTQGPKCLDGSLLRDMRLSRQECPPQEEDRNDMVAPGCEAELLSSSSLGTSQVFAPWMKLRSNASGDETIISKMPPSPEESDYFYDEYVDYPYNQTGTLDANNALGNSVQAEGVTASNAIKQSPHYISGDTPTIYAAPKNKTKPDIPKEVVNSPSTSGFTFFGVPLPAINFNKLLGKGRMTDKPPLLVPTIVSTITADRKVAIVNKPIRSNGRRNMQPPNIPNTSMQPPGIPNMPNEPEIETGGFIPVLPGSGGFKPIIPPHLQPQTSTQFPQEFPTDSINLPNNLQEFGYPTTEEPVVSTTYTNIIKKVPPQPPNPIINNHSQIEKEPQAPVAKIQVQEPTEDPIEEIEEEIITTDNPDFSEPSSTIVPSSTSLASEVETANFEDIYHLDAPQQTLSTQSISSILESTSTPQEKEQTLSTAEANTLVESWSKFQQKDRDKEKSTPLSALLVPGGQQPQFRPSAGRSTITKVQSPHALLTSPENTHVSEPLTNNRDLKPILKPEAPKENDPTNWYFANYNKTVEPFVGSVRQVSNGKSKIDLNLMVQLVLVASLLV